MKTKILSLSLLFSLVGCYEQTPPPAPPEKVIEQVQVPATPAAPELSEEEKKELAEFLAEAKTRDPNIIDAYYSVDAEGNKIINLVRTVTPAPATAAAAGEQQADEGLGMLETVGLAMAGGLVGSMLANALIPNNPSPAHYQQNAAYYQRQTPEEAQRYRNNAVSSYNNQLVSPSSAVRPPVGKSMAPPSPAPAAAPPPANQAAAPAPRPAPSPSSKPTRGFKKRR